MTYWDTLAPVQFSSEMFDGTITECLVKLRPILELNPLDRVLDLGSGIGRMTFAVADYSLSPHIIGVDHSQAMWMEAGCRQLISRHYDRVTFIQNDGCTLPDIAPLDAAFSIAMFQHVPDDIMRGYIEQVADSLRSGGLFTFQFVHSGDESPLSFNRRMERPLTWCQEAGMSLVNLSSTDIPAWCWMTVEKK